MSGLVITEAAAISIEGYAWEDAAAIYNDEQVAGWKRVVDSVHAAGGVIYIQLIHTGRQSHSSYHPDTGDIVGPSAIAVGGGNTACTRLDGSKCAYETPRALTTKEVKRVVQDYREAAVRALHAGFDGVEIHCANGYLIDSFLQSCSNQRSDEYGGTFANRFRILDEIITAIENVYPSYRIGVKVSPNTTFGSMGSEDNFEFFNYVAEQLSLRNLAYLHLFDSLTSPMFSFHAKCRPIRVMDIRKVCHFNLSNY
jgi:N-ethylmaleimide reductase